MNVSSLIQGFLRSQDHRLLTLHTPFPEAGLLLDSLEGREAVSEPFAFHLGLLAEDGNLDLKPFMGKGLRVSLRTADGGQRHFHGHVSDFSHAGTDGGLSRYEATLRPWTDFLAHRFNCKLFQNKSLPTILKEVFSAYGHLARTEFRLKRQDYNPITLCAQYQESDFQFVSRLMEAHGIHYFYRFDEHGHTLVLCDTSIAAENMPLAHRIAFNAIPGAATEDTIDAWKASTRVVATGVAAKTFDFKSPLQPRLAEQNSQHAQGLPPMEDYRYAGAYAYADLEGGKAFTRARREENDLRFETYEGASNCRFLTCGRAFELQGHFRQGPIVHDRRYFVTAVTHKANNNYLNQAGEADYRNRFTAIPALVPYRPPRTTQVPRIHGPQTARVVGPPGEEIFCDEFGRVKVQFHWDRLGAFNEESSCWVRVSSPWAGSNFGIMAVPRVNSEVVVEFLDGNPDHPIITGHMWNLVRMPPWSLPANRTQTGLLTRSTKEGTRENANALRFEDRKGQEEVWLHAERDQRIEVEHDESHTVDHDRRKTIGNDETTEVKHDRTETVGNDENLTVEGDQSLAVGKSQKLSVTRAKTETVGLASTLTVGGAYAVSVGGVKNEAVGMASAEEVGTSKRSKVGSTYTITAGDTLQITVGQSSLTMNPDGSIVLSGTSISLMSSGPIKGVGQMIDWN